MAGGPAGQAAGGIHGVKYVPEAKATFTVDAPIERVWEFLSNLEKVGTCVPGVEQISILDDRTADWTVKIKIGPLSQTVKVRTESLEQMAPNHGAFKGTGDMMDVLGNLDLQGLPGGKTEVTYRMQVSAKGPLARIIDNFMKGRVERETQQFATNVQSKLGP